MKRHWNKNPIKWHLCSYYDTFCRYKVGSSYIRFNWIIMNSASGFFICHQQTRTNKCMDILVVNMFNEFYGESIDYRAFHKFTTLYISIFVCWCLPMSIEYIIDCLSILIVLTITKQWCGLVNTLFADQLDLRLMFHTRLENRTAGLITLLL